jgi:mRNA interferase RelE/StbE
MASYRLDFKPSAERELRKLGKTGIQRVSKAIEALATNPFPHQSEKLSGSANAYRIRVGNYRVIYTIESRVLLITVIRIGHRSTVYRGR